MIDVLTVINQKLCEIGINYEFGRMSKNPPEYPYFVGEYTEPESITEDGLMEPTIILTGFARGSFKSLEDDKTKIRDYFKHGITVLTENNTAIAIYYSSSFDIPIDDGELKKCQINLSVKYWKGK